MPARHPSLRGHSILVYCVDYRYSHCVAISDDGWPDDLRLSDIEERFVCQACGKRGAAGFRLEPTAQGYDGLSVGSFGEPVVTNSRDRLSVH